MSPELAALLDGPVAERWGRPVQNIGTDWSESLKADKDGRWLWYRDNRDGSVAHGEGRADEIWIAHLLDVCVARQWRFGTSYFEHKGKMQIVVMVDGTAGRTGDDLLDTLARAMLAATTEDRP